MTAMRLGERLVSAGLLSAPELEATLSWQRRVGGKLGELLMRARLVPPDALYRVLSQQLRVRLEHIASVRVPPAVLRQLPREVCLQHGVLPVRFVIGPGRGALIVAAVDPFDARMAAAVRAATRFNVRCVLVSPQDLERAFVTNGLLSAPRDLDLVDEETSAVATPPRASPARA